MGQTDAGKEEEIALQPTRGEYGAATGKKNRLIMPGFPK
jgi:hypothetical protein